MAAVAPTLELPKAPDKLADGHREHAAQPHRSSGTQVLRLERAVALLLSKELPESGVVVVDEVLTQVAGLSAVQPHHLVHRHGLVVAGVAPIQEAHLIVGVPAGGPHDLTEDVVEAGDEIAVMLGPVDGLAHL